MRTMGTCEEFGEDGFYCLWVIYCGLHVEDVMCVRELLCLFSGY